MFISRHGPTFGAMPITPKTGVTESSLADEAAQPARAGAVTWAVAVGYVLGISETANELQDSGQVLDGQPAKADEDPLDE